MCSSMGKIAGSEDSALYVPKVIENQHKNATSLCTTLQRWVYKLWITMLNSRGPYKTSSSFFLLRKPLLCFNQLLSHRRILLFYFGSYTATPCSLSKSLIQVSDTYWKPTWKSTSPKYCDLIKPANESSPPSSLCGIGSHVKYSP